MTGPARGVLLGIFLLLTACRAVPSGWHWQPASDGLPRQAIAAVVSVDPPQPARLWAGLYRRGGLLTSSDGGTTWRTLPGPDHTPIFDLLPRSGTLWAATRRGVWTSHDHGLTWQADSTGLPPVAVYTLATDAAGRLYAGLDSHGVYTKISTASPWQALPAPPLLAQSAVLALTVSPDGRQLYAGTAGNGLFSSPDGGRTWRHTVPTGFIANLALNPARPVEAVVAARDRLLHTTDHGLTWRERRLPWERVELTALAWPQADRLLAGTGDGHIFASPDGGASWTRLTPGSLGGAVLDLAFLPDPPRLAAGTWRGVFIRRANSAEWHRTAVEAGSVQANFLLRAGDVLFLAADSGLYRWQANAARWSPIEGWPAGVGVLSLARGGSTLYAGTGGDGVYRSDDLGQTWQALPSLKTGVPALAADPTNPDHLWMLAAWERVYESRDGGQTWWANWDGLGPDMEALTIAASPDGEVLHLGIDNGLFRRVNSQPWEWHIADFLDQSVTALMVQTLPAEVGGGTVLYIGATRGAFRSLDEGLTVQGGEGPGGWGRGLQNVSVTAFLADPHDPRRLFAGTAYQGLFFSADWGFTWRPIGPVELAGQVVKSLAWGPDNELFAATADGVWRGVPSTAEGLPADGSASQLPALPTGQ